MKNRVFSNKLWLFIVQVLVLAGLYFIAGHYSFTLSVSYSIVTLVIFTAEGFALAAVILWGKRLALGVLLGQLALALYYELPWSVALGIALINSVEAIIGASLYQRFALQPTFNRLRDFYGLLFLILLVLQPFSASLGNLLLWLNGHVETEHLLTSWLFWWFGNSLGQLLVTPCLLALFSSSKTLKHRLYSLPWLVPIMLPIGLVMLLPISFSSQTLIFNIAILSLILIATKSNIFLVSLASLLLTISTLILNHDSLSLDNSLLLDLNIHLITVVIIGQFVAVLLAEYKLIQLHQQQTAEHLQNIVNHFPGMIYQFQMKPDGSFCLPYASPAIQQLYRLSPEQVKQNATSLFALLHPEDYSTVLDTMQLSAQQLTPWQHDYRLYFNDGTVRWLSGHSIPQREADGSILWYGFVRDVTDLKQKDIEYQAIIQALSDGFYCNDFKGNLLNVNKALCRILGYSQQELLTMSIYDIGVHKKSEQITQYIKHIINTGYEQFETQYRSKDGKIIDVELSILYEADLGQRFFVFVHDISQRKQMETALRQSRDELQRYFDQPFIGMLTAAHDKHTVHVNQRFCDMVGYSQLEMQTIDWGKLTYPDDLAPNQAYLDQAIRGEIDSYQMEKRYIHKEGHLVYVDLKVNCVRKANGEPDYFVGMMLDITDRKCAEQALQEQQALLQTAQQAAHLGHYVLDLVTLTWTNDAICDEIFGFNAQTIRHISTWQSVIHPDDRHHLMAILQDIMTTGSRFTESNPMDTISYRIIRANDGKERWIEGWTYIFYDDKKRPIQQVGMIQDVTERKLAEHQLKNTTEQLQLVLEGGNLGFWDWNIITGEIQRNAIWAEMLGYSYDEIQQATQQWDDLIYSDDHQAVWQSIYDVLAGRKPYHEMEYRMLHKDGSLRWILDHASIVQRDVKGEPTRMSGTHTNITKLKILEERLREDENFFQSLAQVNPVGIYRTNAEGQCIFINQKTSEIVGLHPEQLIGYDWINCIMPKDREKVYTKWEKSVQQQIDFSLEYRIQQPNGHIIWVYGLATTIRDESNTIIGYVGTLTDITERKNIEQRVHHLAYYDPLTQLANRRSLQERLKHGIELNHRNGSKMAVLMMDLDRFKAVNDTLGHTVGDELLQAVAERIKGRLREVDMVARLGGDEFVIVLDDIKQPDQAAHVATDIIHVLSQAFVRVGRPDIYIGASIGIAICPEHGNSIESLMDNADAALYQAKENGRGCFAYFTEQLTQKAKERLALETRLRKAIEQKELHIHFQPQIAIQNNQIVGAEVLVRWYDPIQESIIKPNEFIHLAEETGLIVAIGEWVLTETCRLGQHWLALGLPPLILSINISSYQFSYGDINTLIKQILQNTGFPAQYLGLEITESGLMNNQQQAQTILNNLHNQGIHLTVDNFGTGYSSLAYLKYFPLNSLKIDISFIKHIPYSQDDNVITSTIINMAHHLGLKVLAEGVETQEQLTFLQKNGCDMYQGHLYSQPLSASDFENVLLKQYHDLKNRA